MPKKISVRIADQALLKKMEKSNYLSLLKAGGLKSVIKVIVVQSVCTPGTTGQTI